MSLHETTPEPTNPLGIAGVEFIEYSTTEPLALGALLERFGFVLVARHRSREVVLYRQGSMNVVVNADPSVAVTTSLDKRTVTLSAIAFRVRDAGLAYHYAVERGAWPIPTRASAMELNIPGVHGAGDSIVYFVDRYQDFSIYDVDFRPVPHADMQPPALAGLHFFGVVQAVMRGRSLEWADFYAQLMGFTELPNGTYFGVVPKGILLQSPCRTFYLQLIEPISDAEEMHWEEDLIRVGLGTPDVPAAVQALQKRGVVFIDRDPVQPTEKGALTQLFKGGVSFELVRSTESHDKETR
ncbi:4-hydroxyphenylpyruvate dioxygenase [Noviherbaspirillum galbum]|uniref:4-hydroxyphenylpyruvate dioxygenase n=1 Tax=Noviherbaspirillum galbum TaxID=2709383 RepID=A0A6B3SY61_9BURK|nr:4-hydroxyphenylpyruvate dioxygenase [Noviherbaspirillum galbum]NEX64625.1 4-hydroxyphenylpyruvate dioxygenase [Noviherbaspirillum galbum]